MATDRAQTIRAFIAVELSEELKAALSGMQDTFRRSGDRVTWVKPGGMHVTLKFLGEIEERRVAEIGAEIRRACAGRVPFPVELFGTGVFPDMKRPRILWAGMRQGGKELGEFFQDLDPRLSEIGFPRERRPFRAHITLGRIKQILDLGAFNAQVEKFSREEFGAMTAGSVNLMESRLRPDGAVYSARLVVPFGEEEP